MNKELLTHVCANLPNDCAMIVKIVDSLIDAFSEIHKYFEFKKHKADIETILEQLTTKIDNLLRDFLVQKKMEEDQIATLEKEIETFKLLLSHPADAEKLDALIKPKIEQIEKIKKGVK